MIDTILSSVNNIFKSATLIVIRLSYMSNVQISWNPSHVVYTIIDKLRWIIQFYVKIKHNLH